MFIFKKRFFEYLDFKIRYVEKKKIGELLKNHGIIHLTS